MRKTAFGKARKAATLEYMITIIVFSKVAHLQNAVQDISLRQQKNKVCQYRNRKNLKADENL